MTSPETPSEQQSSEPVRSATGWPSDGPVRPPVATPPAPQPAEQAAEQPVEQPPAPEPVAAEAPAAEAPAAELPAAPPVVDEPVAEPAAAEPAAAEPAAADGRPARRGRLLSLPVLALLLMTVLMAVATGWIWYQVHQDNATEAARRAGLETSRDAARVLFSYDYRTLSKDFAAGRAYTTGAFAKEYAATTSKVVADVAAQKKAVVKADVVSAGVVRADPHQVVTIVFVNQVTTSTLLSAPKVDLSRVRLTLTKVGSHWLVSKVDAL